MKTIILLLGIVSSTCIAEARATYRSNIDLKVTHVHFLDGRQVLVDDSDSLSIVYSIDKGQPDSCKVVYKPQWRKREVLMDCEFTFHPEKNGEGITVLETSFDYELVINRLVDKDLSGFILHRWPYDYFLASSRKKRTFEPARTLEEAVQNALKHRRSGYVYSVIHESNDDEILKIKMTVNKSRRVWLW